MLGRARQTFCWGVEPEKKAGKYLRRAGQRTSTVTYLPNLTSGLLSRSSPRSGNTKQRRRRMRANCKRWNDNEWIDYLGIGRYVSLSKSGMYCTVLYRFSLLSGKKIDNPQMRQVAGLHAISDKRKLAKS